MALTGPYDQSARFRSPEGNDLFRRGKMVLPVRIELTTSALPRMRSTTELRQHKPFAGEHPRFSKAAPMALADRRCQGDLQRGSGIRRAGA